MVDVHIYLDAWNSAGFLHIHYTSKTHIASHCQTVLGLNNILTDQ